MTFVKHYESEVSETVIANTEAYELTLFVMSFYNQDIAFKYLTSFSMPAVKVQCTCWIPEIVYFQAPMLKLFHLNLP